MGLIKEVVISSLKESTLLLLVSSLISLSLFVVFHFAFISALGLILLIESAGLMLIGGALDLARSASAKKILSLVRIKQSEKTNKNEDTSRKAGIFSLTGVILFLEALILALLFY